MLPTVPKILEAVGRVPENATGAKAVVRGHVAVGGLGRSADGCRFGRLGELVCEPPYRGTT